MHDLDYPQIRYLLTQKGIGNHKNWEGSILRGLNLSGANLNQVNFSEADFQGSKLNGPKLKGSNLSNTLLDKVDLSGGVNRTGPTIETESLPPTAKVDGLICEYFCSESILRKMLSY